MTNIKVPIGRGILQQPRQQVEKEQFTKSLTDRQFIKQLEDEGRIRGATATPMTPR